MFVCRKLPERKQKFRVAMKAGTFGAILEYACAERISDNSSLGCTMVVGYPVGVTCRLKLTRSNQTYLFPFHLSDEILLQPIFYGTIAPVVAWLSIKKLIVEPYQVTTRLDYLEQNQILNSQPKVESKHAGSTLRL